MTKTGGEIYHVFEWEESILLKLLCYTRESIDVIQPIYFKLPMTFSTELEQTIFLFVETPMIPNDQRNIEIKRPEINSYIYSQLIYNKGGKTIQ